jgi:hypothetical protein
MTRFGTIRKAEWSGARKADVSPDVNNAGRTVCDWLSDALVSCAQRGDSAGMLRFSRDRAFFLLWCIGGLEPLEICRFELQQISFCNLGLVFAQPGSERVVRREPDQRICPVAATRLWVTLSGNSEGPLFRRVFSDGTLSKTPLSERAAEKRLRELLMLSSTNEEVIPSWPEIFKKLHP